jgi:plasmid maintenance system killer protein
MRSSRTETFKKLFEKLPAEIREKAVDTFKLWRKNPYYVSLHFKCVDDAENMWSIRITKKWRALWVKDGENYWWHWIGSHNAYDNLV